MNPINKITIPTHYLPALNDKQVIDKIYQLRQTSGGDKELAFAVVLSGIINNFPVFSKNSSAKSYTMPESFQEAIVVLIMCMKDKDDLNISLKDIQSALEALKNIHHATLEIIEKVSNYQDCDFEHLLTKGLLAYNQRQSDLFGKNICVQIIKPNLSDEMPVSTPSIPSSDLLKQFPVELHVLIHSHLPFENSFFLSQTCRKYYLIFNDIVLPPWLSYQSRTAVERNHMSISPRHTVNHINEIANKEKWINYLKQLGISEEHAQKTASGQITLQDAMLMTKLEAELKTHHKYIANADKDLYLEYLKSGHLKMEQIKDLPPYHLSIIAQYVNNGTLKITQFITISLSTEHPKWHRLVLQALETLGVQKYLVNGKLKMAYLIQVAKEGKYDDHPCSSGYELHFTLLLGQERIQHLLDNKKIRIEDIPEYLYVFYLINCNEEIYGLFNRGKIELSELQRQYDILRKRTDIFYEYPGLVRRPFCPSSVTLDLLQSSSYESISQLPFINQSQFQKLDESSLFDLAKRVENIS